MITQVQQSVAFPNFVIALLASIGPDKIHNYCQQDVYSSIVDAILLK